MNFDLIGITELAGELGASCQRAGQLADCPDVPLGLVHPPSGHLDTEPRSKPSTNFGPQRETAAAAIAGVSPRPERLHHFRRRTRTGIGAPATIVNGTASGKSVARESISTVRTMVATATVASSIAK
jgi:hypothetical protein